LKSDAIYFSKHGQVGLKIQVASSEIQVGTAMRVLGVMFDSKLSWGSHITYFSNIVKKKIYALRKGATSLGTGSIGTATFGTTSLGTATFGPPPI
jgi:hypothetical protein